MYNLVKYVPESINNHIVCKRTQNLDRFNLPNIHSLADESLVSLLWEELLLRSSFKKTSNFLINQAKKYQAQILHSHFGHLGWANLHNAQTSQLKHIVTFYGYDVNCFPQQNPIWLTRYQQLFDQISCVLCEGSHMAQSIINLGCPKEKVKVQHLGVKVNNISYKPRKWQQNQPLRILIAASFVEKKGIPYAIEALGRIKDDVDLEITIIGDVSKSKPRYRIKRSQLEKQKILDLITKYKLNSKTKMLGYQSHDVFFQEAYKHHIFLSPSVIAEDGDTEGGAPVSIIETAASGMFVISTTHCDIPEV
ncbi:glycosyltransferase, partial [Hyella patelloides]|uniref:glycosyltransferase n=1 Tax=Hyella patelloides TaxID=1982969 RepID=UPI001643A426